MNKLSAGRNHFDIERSKRVNIQIPGYDAEKEARKITDRARKKSQRVRQAAESKRNEERRKLLENAPSEADLDSLNKSLAVVNPFDETGAANASTSPDDMVVDA